MDDWAGSGAHGPGSGAREGGGPGLGPVTGVGPRAVTVSCDGAARGNPGPAGIGVVVTGPDGRVLARRGRGIGVATNNVAEYRAAIEGLRLARSLGASRVHLRSDSHLLVEQLSGRWRVKDPTLARLYREAMALVRGFEAVSFEHVPRGLNREADRLANRGVDEWLAGPGRGYRHPGPDPRLFDPGAEQGPAPDGPGPGPSGRGGGGASLY